MRPTSLKKRQRYLHVATELFLEQGYDGTGLDQLIERCGGSKMTIYSYFGDKKGLLKAVVTEETEQLREALKFEVLEDMSSRQLLMQFSCRYLKFLYNPRLLKLIRLLIAQNQNEPELVDFFLEQSARYSQSVLQTYLEEQSRFGQLNIDNTYFASEQLLGALKGNRFVEALFLDRAFDEQEMNHYAEHVVGAFLHLYR